MPQDRRAESDMSEKNTSQAVTIKLSWRSVAAVLLATNLISVILWKPWDTAPATVRKITVAGEAVIDAVPDEYVITPYFEFTNADRAVDIVWFVRPPHHRVGGQ